MFINDAVDITNPMKAISEWLRILHLLIFQMPITIES